MASADGHEETQTGTSVVRSAQQASVPGHGTAGHVGPASLALPLLDPLLPPELLPLPLPDPPPLELDPPELLPDEELSVLASGPEAAGLLLPEQPAHSALATTAVAVREKDVREGMAPSVARACVTGTCRSR